MHKASKFNYWHNILPIFPVKPRYHASHVHASKPSVFTAGELYELRIRSGILLEKSEGTSHRKSYKKKVMKDFLLMCAWTSNGPNGAMHVPFSLNKCRVSCWERYGVPELLYMQCFADAFLSRRVAPWLSYCLVFQDLLSQGKSMSELKRCILRGRTAQLDLLDFRNCSSSSF